MPELNLTTLTRDYGDPTAEAQACRTSCALFDFSFVARACVRGPDALALLGRLTGRSMADLAPGQIRYAVRTNADGALISDLTVWKHHDGGYEIMSGRHADLVVLARAGNAETIVEDLTAETAIFAVQGPDTLATLAGLTDTDAVTRLAYFGHCRTRIMDVPCLIGRLGYTGEAGVEIILPKARAPEVWQNLAERAQPAGFAAADILRIEAGFILFANEFRLPVRPAEVGLARFAGAANEETPIRLVCFKARTQERPVLWRPKREPSRPQSCGDLIATSACWSALAQGALGLGYAASADLDEGATLSDPTG
ncbi:MAG: hypothetical protein ACR2PO_20730, partial [Methyloligellaceae bacterium]